MHEALDAINWDDVLDNPVDQAALLWTDTFFKDVPYPCSKQKFLHHPIA